jgi:hypothetical protein
LQVKWSFTPEERAAGILRLMGHQDWDCFAEELQAIRENLKIEMAANIPSKHEEIISLSNKQGRYEMCRQILYDWKVRIINRLEGGASAKKKD